MEHQEFEAKDTSFRKVMYVNLAVFGAFLLIIAILLVLYWKVYYHPGIAPVPLDPLPQYERELYGTLPPGHSGNSGGEPRTSDVLWKESQRSLLRPFRKIWNRPRHDIRHIVTLVKRGLFAVNVITF